MADRLTTHVLDTAHGRPAEGVAIRAQLVSPSVCQGKRTLTRPMARRSLLSTTRAGVTPATG